MKFFLKMKHWQLFVLTIGLPLLIQMLFLVSLFISPESAAFSALIIIPILTLFTMFFLLGWWWTMGTRLYQKLPAGVTMPLGRFKFALLFPFIYILVILFSVVLSFGNPPSDDMPVTFLLIIPLHLFAMLCLFYTIYFNAKVLKTVELGRAVSLSEYLGEFVLLWFFPIGVWIIQPKLNKLFAEEMDELEGNFV